jgi:hypothetical protein
MAEPPTLWYRLGYALESSRPRTSGGRLRSLAERRADSLRPRPPKDDRPERSEPGAVEEVEVTGPLELALAAGGATLVAKLLGAWPGRGRPPLARLARAAVAGAGAAVVRELGARFMGDGLELSEWRDALPERIAAGSARGIVYAAVVEPRVPGPALMRAAAFGLAEHALSPLGGLRSLLARHMPYRTLPVLGELLEESRAGEDTLADHLVFALALGILYGGEGVRIGIGEDAE